MRRYSAKVKLAGRSIRKTLQRYAALLNNVKNITAAIHQIFLANMKGYVLAKQRGELCKADALKANVWNQNGNEFIHRMQFLGFKNRIRY